MRRHIISLLQWLLALALAALAAGCPQREPASGGAGQPGRAGGAARDGDAADASASGSAMQAERPAPVADDPAAAVDASQIYATAQCAVCHAEDLAGKPRLGPPLQGLAAHWTQDELVRYLTDPRGYIEGSPRLQEMTADYAMKMPAVPMPDSDRAVLAAWLLTR